MTIVRRLESRNGGVTDLINAGHKAKANNEAGPIGSSASARERNVASGTRCVSTDAPESKLTIAVSLKRCVELESCGYNAFMLVAGIADGILQYFRVF